jgi:hypothetical protein
MSVRGNDHDEIVASWFYRASRTRSTKRVIAEFEQAFARLWRRAQLALGDVTLTAIFERVLQTAREQFPFLATVDVGPTGIHGPTPTHDIDPEQAAAGFRFVLVEFLTVLGMLTGQILTAALHAELVGRRS